MSSLFAFVQLEFGFLLGPADGRFIVRSDPGADAGAVLVLATLGAPPRRRPRGRRGRAAIEAAAPEPVPTSRATVVAAEPFDDERRAADWLADARGDGDATDRELARALRTINRALHAHRAARSDPYARDVSAEHALVVRLGYGSGDEVVAGRYVAAWEPARKGARGARRSMDAPDERFAALLGGRQRSAACEELALRARMDLDAGRMREAALQARVALEAALAELGDLPGARRAALEDDRGPIGGAANAALAGELPRELAEAVERCVERLESALRGRSLKG